MVVRAFPRTCLCFLWQPLDKNKNEFNLHFNIPLRNETAKTDMANEVDMMNMGNEVRQVTGTHDLLENFMALFQGGSAGSKVNVGNSNFLAGIHAGTGTVFVGAGTLCGCCCCG